MFTSQGYGNVSGTSRQGFINTSYDALVKTFGEPSVRYPDCDKSYVEWHICWPNSAYGVVWATIYDYGLGTGTSVWRVGGHSEAALFFVVSALQENGDPDVTPFGVGSTVVVPSPLNV